MSPVINTKYLAKYPVDITEIYSKYSILKGNNKNGKDVIFMYIV